MVRSIFMTLFFVSALFAKGQNPLGFETMVNALLKNTVDTINSTALEEMLKNDEVVLIDAREYDEYLVSHIPNAIYVGYKDFTIDKLKDVSKDKTVVVYCSVGKRSEDVGLRLKHAGYEQVYNLFGGIFDWTNAGKPVVNENKEKVKCVHPFNSIWGIWINNYDKCYEPR